MSKEAVLQAVVEQLAADLEDADATIARLEQEKHALVMQIADQAFERAAFNLLADRWLQELGVSRKAVAKMKDEIERYTSGQVSA